MTVTASQQRYYGANSKMIYLRSKPYMLRWRKSPSGRFSEHKQNAKKRNIPFLFSLESWLLKWGDSLNAPGMCMARYGDTGPYSPENVRVCTKGENTAERHELARLSREVRS